MAAGSGRAWLRTLAALAVLAALPAGASASGGCEGEALREQQGSTYLPDCRVYELVSPPDKNGGDVYPDTGRTRAAVAGDAVQFVSGSAFGDAAGVTEAADYMSLRSTDPAPGGNGWATHALAPPQAPVPYNSIIGTLDPYYVGEFSPDLETGVFRALSPLTNAPEVANVPNVYVRSGLRTPGPGAYRLLSDCPLCAATETALPPAQNVHGAPFVDGASADFSHVLFESGQQLVQGATATFDPFGTTPNLYESDGGVTRLAGILPDSACGSPPCVAPVSFAGQGATRFTYTPHVISADGRKVFFTDPVSCGCSTDGRDGTLYMRLDNGTPQASTVQLNASEKTNGTGPGGTDANGPQVARYQDASVDGSRVFFTSSEALTNDAPESGHGRLLYMYDTTKPASDPHNLTFLSVDSETSDPTDPAVDVEGTLGTSDDGHVVYFASLGQLVKGGPPVSQGFGIYVWHDANGSSQLGYVGGLAHPDDIGLDDVNTKWGSGLRSRVTPDGQHLLFAATDDSQLVAQCAYGRCVPNTLKFQQLYLYSLDPAPGQAQLRCVSCALSETAPSTPASDTGREERGGAVSSFHINHALSEDGTRVFFHTSEALVPEDTNGTSDVYEWEADGTGSCRIAAGCLRLLSSGTSPDPSSFMDATPNGDDAFFITSERLVGWDTDTNLDLYDAREPREGHPAGFPEPPVPASCAGEACRGALGADVAPVSIGSVLIHGSGNAPAAPAARHKRPRCRRGFVRRRVHGRLRCVRRHGRHGRAGRVSARGGVR